MTMAITMTMTTTMTRTITMTITITITIAIATDITILKFGRSGFRQIRPTSTKFGAFATQFVH